MNALTYEFSRCSGPFFPLLLTPGRLSKKQTVFPFKILKRKLIGLAGIRYHPWRKLLHPAHPWNKHRCRADQQHLCRGNQLHTHGSCAEDWHQLAWTGIFSSLRGKPVGDWLIPRICLVNRDAEKRELLEAAWVASGETRPGALALLFFLNPLGSCLSFMTPLGPWWSSPEHSLFNSNCIWIIFWCIWNMA